MSDPDASIKSIYSGKTAGEKEFDGFASPRSPGQLSFAEQERHLPVSLDARRPLNTPNMASRQTTPGLKFENSSALLQSSRQHFDHRLHPEALDFYDGKNNSTNISLISGTSDYQHGITSDFSESEAPEGTLAEPYSRPLSRNSCTSCLSTTATKDGIEGKRISKPQVKLFENKFNSIQNPTPGQEQVGPQAPEHSKLRHELDELPPISLKEKMQMMDNPTNGAHDSER